MEKTYTQLREIILNKPDYKYEGIIDWEKLKGVITTIEDFTKKISDIRAFHHKAFHTLVEMLQNAYRYKVGDTSIKVYVKQNGDKLYLNTENTLSIEDLKNLKYLLEIINSLSLEELKQIKIEQLTTGKVEPQFKKYNGMMSIRRRTANKLFCDFARDEQNNSIVSLIATINIGE